MRDDAPGNDSRSEAAAVDVRLDSWKEIAAYLKRDATTVRRWEKREGLPVHRHLHDRRDSVYAYRTELDRWWQGRAGRLAANASIDNDAADRARWPWALVAMSVAVALVAVAMVGVFRRPSAPGDSAEVRFTIEAPARAAFGTASISPDGRGLAFTASMQDGRSLLWIRPLDSVTAAPFADSDGAAFPFWSPDSQSIGFFAQGKLKTVAATGGAPRIVCDAPDGLGGSWSRDGVIVFAPGSRTALFRVPAAGGAAVPVTTLDQPREISHRWPAFLPDGRHFLYVADSVQPEYHGVYAGALDAPDRKRLFDEASNVSYVSEGYLLFARERRLVARPFDADRLEWSGEPVVVGPNVREHFDVDHLFDFSASDSGVLVYRRMPNLETRLVWRDRGGGTQPFAREQALYADPTISPDGTRLAVSIFDPLPSHRFGFGLGKWTSDIWIFDVATGAGSRFTFDQAADFEPAWSPDSTRIVFASNRGGSLDMYRKSARGGPEELMLRSPGATRAQAWSPDERFIVYATVDPATRWDLWMLPTSGDRRPRPLLRSEFNENQATVSPDGRWIAYTSDETGRYEVYVQNFPALDRKWQISTRGGGDARWRADGRELFYIAENGTLMAVAVKTGTTFEPGAGEPLFDSGNQPGWAVARNHYDVSRDGRRFLVMSPVDADRSSALTLVVNWAASLRN